MRHNESFGLPSLSVYEPKYLTWNLRPLFSSLNTIYERIFELDNTLGLMEAERVVEKSIGITTNEETRLSIGAMTKAGINLDDAIEQNNSGSKNYESSLSLGFEKIWSATRATTIKQKDVFRISPGEHFWICQKNQLLNYWPNNEEIVIKEEALWVKGNC